MKMLHRQLSWFHDVEGCWNAMSFNGRLLPPYSLVGLVGALNCGWDPVAESVGVSMAGGGSFRLNDNVNGCALQNLGQKRRFRSATACVVV